MNGFRTLSEEYNGMKARQHDLYLHQQRLQVLGSLKEGFIRTISQDEADALINEFKMIMEGSNFMKRENIAQMLAFDKLGHGDNKLINVLMWKFGGDFRDIINAYEEEYGKPPSDDDLIWIAGVHAKRDPREIVAEIEQEAEELGGTPEAWAKLAQKYKELDNQYKDQKVV